jgi:hypothetical protein
MADQRDQRDRDDAGAGLPAEDAELRARLRGDSPPGAELDALFRDTLGRVQAERGLSAYLRSRTTLVRVLCAVALVVALAAAAALAFLRPDFSVYPQLRMVLVLAVIVGGLGVNAWLALRPLQLPALPAWAAPISAAAALVALLAFYMLPAPETGHPASVHAPGAAALLARALPCIGIGTGLGLVVFLAFTLLHRGGVWRGLAIAAAAGLTANLVLQLHCPLTAPGHMIAAHLGVALLLVGFAALRARTQR